MGRNSENYSCLINGMKYIELLYLSLTTDIAEITIESFDL